MLFWSCEFRVPVADYDWPMLTNACPSTGLIGEQGPSGARPQGQVQLALHRQGKVSVREEELPRRLSRDETVKWHHTDLTWMSSDQLNKNPTSYRSSIKIVHRHIKHSKYILWGIESLRCSRSVLGKKNPTRIRACETIWLRMIRVDSRSFRLLIIPDFTVE